MILRAPSKNTKKRGYIALISTIVISLILLALVANMSTAGFYARFNSLDTEYKRISLGLAESCVHAALLKLAKENTYEPPGPEGETISVGSDSCVISEVLTDAADPTKKTIKTKGNFHGAFSNMEISSIVQDPAVAPVNPGRIWVVFHVMNDNGGTASAGDFIVHLTAVNPSESEFAGAETGKLITADAGPYSMDVDGPPDYLTLYSSDCSGTIAESEEKTCTITSNDKPTTATLTVIANVKNDNGGTKGPGDFPLFVDGVAVSNGVGVTLSPGLHTVTGTGASGYDASPWGTHCAGDGTITLSAGDSKTCSITYDDEPPPSLACADTVMMLDRTGSMGDVPPKPLSPARAALNAAAKKLLDLYSTVSPIPQVGIGSLEGLDNSHAQVPVAGWLTKTYGVASPATGLYALTDAMTNTKASAGKGTNLGKALQVGDAELNSARHDPTLKKVLILFSDGMPTLPFGGGGTTTPPDIEYALDNADSTKIPHGPDGKSTEIFTIYFGADGSGRNLMAQLATGDTSIPAHAGHTPPAHQPGSKNNVVTGSPAEIAAENSDDDNFFTSPSVDDMVPIFDTIAHRICPAIGGPPAPPPPTTGTLWVITEVVNDNGGTKTAGDFSMIVSAVNPSIGSFPGVAAPGREVTVDPGSYSIDEGPTGPYVKTIGAGCSGTIDAGDTRTCTIRNDDTPTPSSPPPPPPPPPPITIESWVEQPGGP